MKRQLSRLINLLSRRMESRQMRGRHPRNRLIRSLPSEYLISRLMRSRSHRKSRIMALLTSRTIDHHPIHLMDRIVDLGEGTTVDRG